MHSTVLNTSFQRVNDINRSITFAKKEKKYFQKSHIIHIFIIVTMHIINDILYNGDNSFF